jgi:WD40 repeat protein
MSTRVPFFLLTVALVCSLDAQVRLRSPSQGQVLFPTRVVRIEWDNATTLPVDVRYSTDRGSSWIPIATALSLESIEWKVPMLDTLAVLLQVQLTATGAPRPLATLELPDSIRSAWWSGEGLAVTALVRKGMVCQSQSTSPPMYRSAVHGLNRATHMCRYPHALDSVVIAQGTQLYIVSTQTGVVRTELEYERASEVTSLDAHPRLPIVAAGYSDGIVRIWNLVERRMIGSVRSQALGGVTAIAFHPDGELLAHSGADGVIIVEPWQALGSSERIWLRHANDLSSAYAVTALAFSPRGKYLVSAGVDGTVRLWNYANWYAERVFADLQSLPTALAFSGDGSRLFAGSSSGVLCQWSIAGGELLHPPHQLGEAIIAIGAHPFNDTVFVASASGKLTYWTFERTPIASDSIEAVVRYPFGLRVGSCRGAVGDTVVVPILLDQDYRIPLFERSQFLARCTVVLPPSAALVGDRSLYATHRRVGMYDTLTVPLSFGRNDTVGVIPLQLLASSRPQEEISVLAPIGITWERSVGAFVLERVENGEIVIDTLCPVQQRRIPTFTEKVEAFVAPNPVQDRAMLVFSAIEAGRYEIELQSLARANAELLVDALLEPGVHRIELNVGAFASGAYRLVIKSPSEITAVSLLIVR